MASFTDNAQALSKFNPYIQQLPVEEMTAVGKRRQQAHDEGVQKIQTQIDNIAGIPVARDVDKAYLQSKINQLGNNLRVVAAGDFSNFQLVNSVGGMTKQISNDPYIKSAVASTENDKKEMAAMAEDKKKGTLTPQAEYYYNLKRQKYYGNQNLKNEDGTPIDFTGKYTQSWDIDKNLQDAIKGVGEGKWTAENVFKTNPATGEILKNKDGSPIYSEFAIKETREGKFDKNVAAAIDGVMSRPEARQELAMRGVYNYKGIDTIDAFVKGYEKEKATAIKNISNRKLELMSDYTTEKDPAKKKEIQTLIDKADQLITEAEVEDPRITDARQFSDVDSYKAALETRRVRNNYMISGVTEHVSKEYIKSVPYEVAREKTNDEREWWAKQQTVAISAANLDIAKKNQQLAEKKQLFEEEKWKYDPKNPAAIKTGGVFTEGATKTEPFGEIYSKTMQAGEDLKEQHVNESKEFVKDYIIAVNAGNGKTLTDEQAMRSVNMWMKQDPNWLTSFTEKAKTKVKRDPKNIYYTDLATSIPSLERTETALVDHGNLIGGMKKDPKILAAGEKELNTEALKKDLQSIDIVSYEGGFMGFGGTKVTKTLTPQDIVDFNMVKKNNADVPKRLTEKFGASVQTAYQVATDPVNYANSGITGRPMSAKEVQNIQKVQGSIESQKFKNVLAAKEEYLRNHSLGNESKLYPMYQPDAKAPQINTANQNVLNILNTWKEANKDADIDVSNYASAFSGKEADKSKYTVNVGVDRSGAQDKFTLELYDGGSQVQTIPISGREAKQIRPDLTIAPRVSRINQIVQQSPQGNTSNSVTSNLNASSAYTGAYLKQNYFINQFNRTDILGADTKTNKMGEVNLYLYKKDADDNVVAIPIKRSNSVYPEPFTSHDDAMNFLQTSVTTSGQIDNFIKNTK